MNDTAENLSSLVSNMRGDVEGHFQPIIDLLLRIASEFKLRQFKRDLNQQMTRLTSELFEIIFIGPSRAGKSTLLSALLRSNHIPDTDMPRSTSWTLDPLPHAPVLIRIVYAAKPVLSATYLNGSSEDWTFPQYREEARRYAEMSSVPGGSGLSPSGPAPFAAVKSFEIGLPNALLKAGFALSEAPAIHDNPRRTSLIQEALARADAVIMLARSDMPSPADFFHFATAAAGSGCPVISVVNFFAGRSMTDCMQPDPMQGRNEGQEIKDIDRAGSPNCIVDCKTAWDGYHQSNLQKVQQSGFRSLEGELGSVLVNGAYQRRVAVVKRDTNHLINLLEEEMRRQRIVLHAEPAAVNMALSECTRAVEKMKSHRHRILAVFEETIRTIICVVSDSYHNTCHSGAIKLQNSVREALLHLAASTYDQMSEAPPALIESEVCRFLRTSAKAHLSAWATDISTAGGLQRDLKSHVEVVKRKAVEEYQAINTIVQAIGRTIGALDPEDDAEMTMITLRERMAITNVSAYLLGPIASAGSAGVWHSEVEATVAALAAQARSALEVIAAEPTFASDKLMKNVPAVDRDDISYPNDEETQRRYSEQIVAAIKSALPTSLSNEFVLNELTRRMTKILADEAQDVLFALDHILRQQEQSLALLRDANNYGLKDKQTQLVDVYEALDDLAQCRAALSSDVRLPVSHYPTFSKPVPMDQLA